MAIRDLDQLNHMKVLKADFGNYRYLVTDGQGLQAEVKLLQKSKEGYLFKLIDFIDEASSAVGKDLSGLGEGSTLFLPIVKQAAIEKAITSVSQLGIYSRIILFFSDFTRYTVKTYSPLKLKRLNKLSVEAVKQSKGKLIPQIDVAQSLEEALSDDQLATVLVGDSRKSAKLLDFVELKDQIVNSKTQLSGKTLGLVIGPEGGFSPQEYKLLENTESSLFFHFGNTILTTDTAAILFSAFLVSLSQI